MDTINLKNMYSNMPSLKIIGNVEERFEENSGKIYFIDKEKRQERICYLNNSGKFHAPFQTPDDVLIHKIIQQVEFLFSDANLSKDKFLLKHIRRNKEGYVSLKLISSLRKVKALTKDWRVVAYSLKMSEKLQLNEEKTKIKRVAPLKIFEDLDSARTVLVFHIIPSCCTSESMKNILNKLGTVTLIRIVNSKADIMSLIVKKSLKLYQSFATFPFAIVQFETSDEAASAILQTTHPSSILKILPLAPEDNENAKCSEMSLSKEDYIPDANAETNTNMCDKISSESSELSDDQIKSFSRSNSSSASENIKLSKSDNRKKGEKGIFRFQEMIQLPNVPQDKDVGVLTCEFRGDGYANNRHIIHRKPYFEHRKQLRVIALRHPKGPDDTKGFHGRRADIGNIVCI